MGDESAPAKFQPLPAAAIDHLSSQRTFVSALIAELLPSARLSGGRADLAVLQEVIDAKVLNSDHTWELQSLGVAFGDALVDMIDGLAWWEVSDEYGTDPTLRYRETSFQVNALTMISKRVEAGRTVDLERLAAQTAASLADFLRP